MDITDGRLYLQCYKLVMSPPITLLFSPIIRGKSVSARANLNTSVFSPGLVNFPEVGMMEV